MSKSTTFRAFLLLALVTSGLQAIPLAAEDCFGVSRVELDHLAPKISVALGPQQSIRFDLPQPGVLILAAEAVASEPRSEALDVAASPCNPSTGVSTLGHRPGRRLLAMVEAGSVRVHVASRDGVRGSSGTAIFRLHARFLPARAHHESQDLDLAASGLWAEGRVRLTRTTLILSNDPRKAELEEFDPNPGGLTAPPRGQVDVVTLEAPGGPLAEPGLQARLLVRMAWIRSREGFGKAELEEFDPNPGGLTASPATARSVALSLLARVSETAESTSVDVDLWSTDL
ncbi:MAG: hypothetical protein AAGC60_03510 [Acidobacteriota bacterium]